MANEGELIPGEDLLSRTVSVSRPSCSSSQSALNHSPTGMLQRSNLWRNAVLPSPDVSALIQGKEGQVEGAGYNKEERRGNKTEKEHAAIFLQEAFVQPAGYLVIRTRHNNALYLFSLLRVCVIGVRVYYQL